MHANPQLQPCISVVMPTYGEPLDVLRRTVDSVLAQTFSDLELVIVVDNPDRRDAIEMLQSYAKSDRRVRVHINEANIGVWPSYNRGVRLTRGRYIAIQDADDVSLPTRLEVLHSFLESNPGVDVVGCSLRYVDAETGARLLERHYPADISEAIRQVCPVAHATTLRKAGLHEQYGYYDESHDVRHAADYELWLRWYLRGVCVRNVQDVLYLYYQNRSNFKARNVKNILRDTVRLKRRYSARLAFGLMDRMWMLAESAALFLPSGLILRLFYVVSRLRSKRRVDIGSTETSTESKHSCKGS